MYDMKLLQMTTNGLISIILPVYNGANFLEQSIESCLTQTHQNIELIIVNDCSTDDSLTIAGKYQKKDSRVKIINNIINKKLPASLNLGHAAATGSFITWTSHDNWYAPDALQQLLSILKNNNAGVAYSNVNIVNTDGSVARKHTFPNPANILFGNVIGSCFLYRKAVFETVGGYDENLFLLEDYDFWLKATLNFKFVKLKKFLYNYRKHSDSLTAQIQVDSAKKILYENNLNQVFLNFYRMVGVHDIVFMTRFSIDEMFHQKKNFLWHRDNCTILKKSMEHVGEHSFLIKKKLEEIHLEKVLASIKYERSFTWTKLLFLAHNFSIRSHIKFYKTYIKYALKI